MQCTVFLAVGQTVRQYIIQQAIHQSVAWQYIMPWDHNLLSPSPVTLAFPVPQSHEGVGMPRDIRALIPYKVNDVNRHPLCLHNAAGQEMPLSVAREVGSKFPVLPLPLPVEKETRLHTLSTETPFLLSGALHSGRTPGCYDPGSSPLNLSLEPDVSLKYYSSIHH